MRQKKAKTNLVNVITAGNVISSTVSNVKFGYVKMSGLELYVKSFWHIVNVWNSHGKRYEIAHKIISSFEVTQANCVWLLKYSSTRVEVNIKASLSFVVK